MAIITTNDIEEERLVYLEDDKENKDVSPGSFSFHEALHTTYVLFETFNRQIVEHPAIYNDKELFEESVEIRNKMFFLYQELGRKQLVEENKEEIKETENK